MLRYWYTISFYYLTSIISMFTQTCSHCQSSFEITQWDMDFYTKVSPKFGEQRFQIPTPTLCPDCRQRRRMAFRNERALYRRICDANKQPIISIYSPDKPYKVYDQKIRRSDGRDPMSYGRDFDFSKSFRVNIQELLLCVPKKWLVSEYNENCTYTNICWYCKDCYLISASEKSEKCCYWNILQDSNNIVDGSFIYNSSHIYNSINCHHCFNSQYIVNCKQCSDCIECYNLIWCSFCYQCYDLQNQQYCINNIVYSKEEYMQKLWIINIQHDVSLLTNLMKKSSHTIYEWYNNEHISWKYINNSKDVYNSIDIEKGEKISHSQIIVEGVNLYDCTNVYIANEMSLEIMSALSSKFNLCSGFIYNCSHCLYSINLNDSQYCFWCDGLRNKSYCIFNKQYTKEEYEKTVAKIIAHMIETKERGEFFHPSLSPFWYNETVAQEYYPTQKWELSEFGYQRSDYQAPAPVAENIISADELPDIDTVWDDILQKAIRCEATGKLFRLQRMELEFYRKHNIPLPRRHPDQRHLDRIVLRK